MSENTPGPGNRPDSESRSDLENTENISGGAPPDMLDSPESPRPKRRILIGSQRNPDAYRPKSLGDAVAADAVETPRPQTVSVAPPERSPDTSSGDIPDAEPFERDRDDDTAEISAESESREPGKIAELKQPVHKPKVPVVVDENAEDETSDHLSEDGLKKLQALPVPPVGKVPIPRRRGPLSDDLEAEFDQLFAGTEIDSLLEGADAVASQAMIEPETKLKAKILRQGREQVFFDLGGRNEGMLSLRMFADDECPKVGDEMEVIVSRFLPEEGLYELTRPLAAADVKDWAQVHEDMVVEALVTKANTGGAECMVNRLRGFIPISQLAQFRVENAEDFVGQKLTCVVIECDPASRNLVLSRRSMIEREREELRKKTLGELEVGQTREGVVRKIIDVGAFVDLGGVDGFIHISSLSWGRVRHPGDVLQEGQHVKVKVTKIDLENNRISLTYRDDAANPWVDIFERFQEKSPARGKVVKIMDFGAFVELVPGVEGLVHISELSHKRVGSVGEVVREGDWVDVYVQSIDAAAKRISLSMKQLMPEPKREESEDVAGDTNSGDRSIRPSGGKGKGRKEDQEPVAEPLKIKNPRKGPLKGGTDEKSDGDRFGLKW